MANLFQLKPLRTNILGKAIIHCTLAGTTTVMLIESAYVASVSICISFIERFERIKYIHILSDLFIMIV